MNLLSIIDKLDDKLNPIVVKELRQAVKSRMVVGILVLFLGVQLFLLGFVLLVREARESAVIDWSAGHDVFLIQQGILLVTIMILVPAYACIRLANDDAAPVAGSKTRIHPLHKSAKKYLPTKSEGNCTTGGL